MNFTGKQLFTRLSASDTPYKHLRTDVCVTPLHISHCYLQTAKCIELQDLYKSSTEC